VETSGHPSSVDTIIDAAPLGSTVVLVGGDTTVPAMVILTRELEVRASKGGRGLYPEAVALVASGRLAPVRLISHRFAVKDIARAFDISSQRQDTVSRSVLDMTAW
jgi:L-iditol 2-dehydrogenase